MKVSEAMISDVCLTSPDQSMHEAVHMMAEIDVGVLPVGENDRLVGMITDRDIAIRAVAEGRAPETIVRKVITHDVLYCFEDEDLDEVARQMNSALVRIGLTPSSVG